MKSRHRLHLANRSESQRFEDMTEDPTYYFWAKNEPKKTPEQQKYIDWVEEHYRVDYPNLTLTRYATSYPDGREETMTCRGRPKRPPPDRPKTLLEPSLARQIETTEDISKAQAAEASRAASSSVSDCTAPGTPPDAPPVTRLNAFPDMPPPCEVCTHFAIVIQAKNGGDEIRHGSSLADMSLEELQQITLRKTCQDCGCVYEDISPSWDFLSCKHLNVVIDDSAGNSEASCARENRIICTDCGFITHEEYENVFRAQGTNYQPPMFYNERFVGYDRVTYRSKSEKSNPPRTDLWTNRAHTPPRSERGERARSRPRPRSPSASRDRPRPPSLSSPTAATPPADVSELAADGGNVSQLAADGGNVSQLAA